MTVKDMPHLRIYHQPIRTLQAAAPAGRQELAVLLELGCHADKYGWCWPGLNRLARQTHYARSTVISAIERLLGRDYLRYKVVEGAPGKYRLYYQISPGVHCVGTEERTEAWAQYNALPLRNTLPDFVTNESQPIYNQAPEPTIVTNTRTSTTTTPTGGERQNGGSEPSLHEKTEGQKASAKDNLPTANESFSTEGTPNEVTSTASASPSRASPPISAAPPPDFDGNQPLSDAECEAAANDVKSLHSESLSLANARLLVYQYGARVVMAESQRVRNDPALRNPVAVMIAALRRGVADDGTAPKEAPQGSRFLNGRYGDYIDS